MYRGWMVQEGSVEHQSAVTTTIALTLTTSSPPYHHHHCHRPHPHLHVQYVVAAVRPQQVDVEKVLEAHLVVLLRVVLVLNIRRG